MKKWTPAQLKLLVDKTIEEIIANPFEQGRCFLHNTVEFVLNHDPEVKQLVPSISNITYNILRQRGFIEAFDKAWAEYHGPGNKVDVHIHINSSPEAMPLDQLLDLCGNGCTLLVLQANEKGGRNPAFFLTMR